MWSQLLRVCLAASLVASSGLAQAREAADRLQVTILVYNDADVEPAALLAAERTAANIYKEAGVDMVWMNCLSQAGPEVDRCKPATDPRQLILRIEHQAQALTADKYGVAYLGADGRGKYCDVFFDRMLEVWRAEPASDATILGIVMAHELGHLLLGFNAHSAAGIMRAQWRFKDFFWGELGRAFSPEEIRTIRGRLIDVMSVQRASE